MAQPRTMYIAPSDATLGEAEWRPFVEATGFGHLVAAGRDRDVPVVVPTQFLLEEDTVRLHLVRTNPLFSALAENPRVLLSVAGDWAFIPSAWKAIGDEDPAAGHPHHLLRRRAADRHGDGPRRAPRARQRGRRPAPAAARPPTRPRRGRPRGGTSAGDHVDPRHQHRRRRRCRRSSSTAAMSTRPTGSPSSITCRPVRARVTPPRPAT